MTHAMKKQVFARSSPGRGLHGVYQGLELLMVWSEPHLAPLGQRSALEAVRPRHGFLVKHGASSAARLGGEHGPDRVDVAQSAAPVRVPVKFDAAEVAAEVGPLNRVAAMHTRFTGTAEVT